MVLGVSPAAGFYAHDDDRAVGYAHIAPADNDAADRWSVSLVVDPRAESPRETVAGLLRAASRQIADQGGGTLVLWREEPDAAEDAGARDAGFHLARELFQMRVPLPIAESPTWPSGVSLRTFRPGEDDAEWLEVNNRAFAGHAEQGDWTSSTLQQRMAESWFDPSLFFVATVDDRIVGFNWCKVHPATEHDPALGEIYVIGVDPKSKVRGVGRPLALTGLDAMARRGVSTGMLYSSSDNDRALRLYRSLGFDVHRVDRAYECTVQAQP